MNINSNPNAPISEAAPVFENKAFAEMSENEKIDVVAAKILNKYRAAFEELAK